SSGAWAIAANCRAPSSETPSSSEAESRKGKSRAATRIASATLPRAAGSESREIAKSCIECLSYPVGAGLRSDPHCTDTKRPSAAGTYVHPSGATGHEAGLVEGNDARAQKA